MKPNQSKRPRKEDPIISRLTSKYTREELQRRSPYERKVGKIILTCSKCVGEGKVRAPPSKKARARRKRMQQNSADSGDTTPNNTPAPPPTMKACRACDGSGLIAIPPSSDPTISSGSEDVANGNAKQIAPRVHPGISVAIVGGGIGGMALAAALQHRDIPCTVFERDVSFEERKQGYGLTMQQGARALRSLGFFSFSDDDGDADDPDKKREGSESEKEDDGSQNARFGIHSTRHVVHKPDGTVVGEWGMKVWGGRFEKNNRKHAKRQNAHISRQGLRELLMEMLRPGTIKWGHKFVGYEERIAESDCDDGGDEKSNLSLTFRRRRLECQGTDEECDDLVTTSATLLVGCDGIRSAVRANKLGDDVAPLGYLDCIVVLGIVASPDSALTDGETVFQTADGVTRLYAMPFARAGEEASSIGMLDGDRSNRGLSMWQLSFPMDESDAKELSKLGPSALKAEALKRCGRWHDPIPTLLSRTPEELITGYPCYDRALVDKGVFRDGCNAAETASGNPFVTMLGDAAHPMSPFKGQGANQALLDAVLLARKLYSTLRIDNKKSNDQASIKSRIPAALAEFEDEMLERSAVKVKKSADAAKFLHTHVAISEGNVTRGAAAADDDGS